MEVREPAIYYLSAIDPQLRIGSCCNFAWKRIPDLRRIICVTIDFLLQCWLAWHWRPLQVHFHQLPLPWLQDPALSRAAPLGDRAQIMSMPKLSPGLQ